MTTWAALLAILGALGYVLGLRRKARKAEAERDQQRDRAETAEVAHAADREADRKETAAHAQAEAAIPVPDMTDAAAAVAEIDAARRNAAAKRVRAQLGKGGRR